MTFETSSSIFEGLNATSDVWMSHGDEVDTYSDSWDMIAKSNNNIIAALSNKEKPYYGVQFHPERSADHGIGMISTFLNS